MIGSTVICLSLKGKITAHNLLDFFWALSISVIKIAIRNRGVIHDGAWNKMPGAWVEPAFYGL